MASSQNTIDYIIEQISGAQNVIAKKMFGEYAIYCNEKIVALVCDDQLFIKPTKAGKDFTGNVVEGNPYPGAKPYFLISGELWEDNEWLSQLISITTSELPLPKKKPSRKNAK